MEVKAPTNNEHIIKLWPQLLGTLTICLASITRGSLLMYPTKALPQLQSHNETSIELNKLEGAIFAAAASLEGAIFASVGGFFAGWIGRRKALLISSPFVILGFLLIALAENKIMLFVGRILSAIAVTLHTPAEGVYISETAHPKFRGSLLVLPNMGFALGMLFIWTVSYFCTWRITAFIATTIPALMIAILIFLPESPYWLIEHDFHEQAKKALQFYRGKDYDVTLELKEIQEKSKFKKLNSNSQTGLRRLWSKAFFRPFAVAGVLSIGSQMAGFNITAIYMIEILREAGSSIDPNIAPIIFGASRVFVGVFPSFIVRKVSAKLFFSISHLITTIAYLGFTIFVFIYKMSPNSIAITSLGWIPLVTMLITQLMRSSGILPILDMLDSELYPTEIRTESLGVTRSTIFATAGISTFLYPFVVQAIGLYGVFTYFTILSLFCTIWGFLSIPDTRGQSLVKIEEIFEKK